MKRTRKGLLVCLAAGGLMTMVGRTTGAQQPSLKARDVGQMANALLDALIPPTDSLSRVPIVNRQIVFDVDRTLASFGVQDAASESQSLQIHRAASHGSKKLLDDCDSRGMRDCASLGWKAYVWLAPVSVSATDAVVRLHVLWPDRGTTKFTTGLAPNGEASLVGYAAEVRLSRASGTWKFVERIRTMVR